MSWAKVLYLNAMAPVAINSVVLLDFVAIGGTAKVSNQAWSKKLGTVLRMVC